MQKNVGTVDRAIRALVGIIAIAAYFTGMLQGGLGIAALVVGIVMLGTATLGWCPPYAILGINTCAIKQAE